ncbi:MAG: hypothetical protein AAFX94_10520 [Myxococcota bacterium]
MRLTLLLALLCASCGFDDDDVPVTPQDLVVISRTERDVLELYFHTGEDFSVAENELSGPLATGETLRIEDVSPELRVTYVRTESDLSDRFRITSETSLNFDGPDYALELYDDGFRLLEPDHPNNPATN